MLAIHTVYLNRWLRSDMKDRAYFYVFKFYEKVMEVGGLNESDDYSYWPDGMCLYGTC